MTPRLHINNIACDWHARFFISPLLFYRHKSKNPIADDHSNSIWFRSKLRAVVIPNRWWRIMLVFVAFLLLSLCAVPRPAACATQKTKAAGKQQQQQQEPQYYFWNEVTNEVQWEGEICQTFHSLCSVGLLQSCMQHIIAAAVRDHHSAIASMYTGRQFWLAWFPG